MNHKINKSRICSIFDKILSITSLLFLAKYLINPQEIEFPQENIQQIIEENFVEHSKTLLLCLEVLDAYKELSKSLQLSLHINQINKIRISEFLSFNETSMLNLYIKSTNLSINNSGEFINALENDPDKAYKFLVWVKNKLYLHLVEFCMNLTYKQITKKRINQISAKLFQYIIEKKIQIKLDDSTIALCAGKFLQSLEDQKDANDVENN